MSIHPFVRNGRFPGILNLFDFGYQPSPGTCIVGKKLEVVSRSTERSNVRQSHLVPSVHRTLVDKSRCGHCLKLIEFLALHGVNLFEVNQDVLRHSEKIVLGKTMAVGLRRIITAQHRRQQVLHKGALETALTAQEDQNHMVHHLVVEHSGKHAHYPAAEILAELGGRKIDTLHHGCHPADVIRLSVPGRKAVEILL